MVKQHSTWADSKALPAFPKLQANLNTEVAIIGGGMAGILTAYELAKAGKNAVVLESGQLLSGATLRTTGFLTHIIDTSVTDLISMLGKHNAKQVWQSHKLAIDKIEKIVRKQKIDCEFSRCPNYIIANNPEEGHELADELKAIKQIGFKGSLGTQKLGFNHAGYLEIKNQAKFHPLKFLQAIVMLAQDAGVQFFENSEVKNISGNGPFSVNAGKFKIKTDYTVIATYDPLNNPRETFLKKGMYISYVFEVSVPRGQIKPALYEDLQSPYHYFRLDRGVRKDRLIIGGEDNRMELAVADRKNFAALRSYLKSLLGKTKFTITKKWSGRILEPSDGLALIGQLKPRQFVATAFSGNGMTYSMIAAQMICDLIIKKKNRWQKLYDPRRKLKIKSLLKKAVDYGEEFFGGVAKNIFKWKQAPRSACFKFILQAVLGVQMAVE